MKCSVVYLTNPIILNFICGKGILRLKEYYISFFAINTDSVCSELVIYMF